MANKVIIEATKGALRGKTYEYSEKTRIFIGRQEDCGIVTPENTVGRYHCVLEITPPEVKLQDFYSLNGTFLNGNKIGQRDRDQSFEDAKNAAGDSEAFVLHDGDTLGLGSKCEFRLKIEAAEHCAKCGRELGEATQSGGTVLEGQEDSVAYYNDAGERVCVDCHLEAEKARIAQLIAKRKLEEEEARLRELREKKEAEEAERKRIEALRKEQEHQEALRKEQERIKRETDEKRRKERELAAQKEADRLKKEREGRERQEKERIEAQKRADAEREIARQQRLEAERLQHELEAQLAAKPMPQQKKCAGCGKPFIPKAPDNNLCDTCLADRAKVLDVILGQLLGGASAQKQEAGKPSVIEGYDKVSLLGKGGMGEVWKVKERKTGKFYALKTMLPKVAADETSKKLFLREAGVCECLKHKNVVKAYKTGCADGTFYILMDLCEGGSVDGLMERKGGKLSLELATYIILQVLTGLDYVHNMDIDVEINKGFYNGSKEVDAKGVVHRDFKPGNIFLSDKSDHPVAMVADFGMAKAFDTAGLSKITKTGAVMGTPVFMPRQQAINFKYAKPEVDVWAAAASYYNMLTGAFPKNFRPGKNVWQIIVTEPAVPIRQRNSAIPQKLADVIDKALIEQPVIGYQSAAVFRRDIIAALPENVRTAVKGVLK